VDLYRTVSKTNGVFRQKSQISPILRVNNARLGVSLGTLFCNGGWAEETRLVALYRTVK